jgi:hypothetical protein
MIGWYTLTLNRKQNMVVKKASPDERLKSIRDFNGESKSII